MRDDSQPPFPLDDAPFFDEDEDTAAHDGVSPGLLPGPSGLDESDGFLLAGLTEPPDEPAASSENDTFAAAAAPRSYPQRPATTRRTAVPALAEREDVAPCDLPAERAILACCMLDATAIALAIDFVQPDDFFETRHRLIFASARRLMDQNQILLVNLARGQVGEDTAALLGSLLVTTIGLAAFSRSDTPEGQRAPFYLYLDEFQNFTTASVATMISELRKYKVGLILANQHMGQLTDDVRDAVLGNVGTLITFRVGPHDASLLAKTFGERFTPLDLMNLPNHHIYLRLMIDGAPSKPFSATTILPSEVPGGRA